MATFLLFALSEGGAADRSEEPALLVRSLARRTLVGWGLAVGDRLRDDWTGLCPGWAVAGWLLATACAGEPPCQPQFSNQVAYVAADMLCALRAIVPERQFFFGAMIARRLRLAAVLTLAGCAACCAPRYM